MIRKVGFCAALAAGAALVAACEDDDSVFPFQRDGGTVLPDASTGRDAESDGPVTGTDGGDARDAGGDAAIRDRLLLSYNGATESELAVLDLQTRTIAGRLKYPGFIGATFARGADPYLMQQSSDVVARLDRAEPWRVSASWTVRLDDKPEGGTDYADPNAVLVATPTKAYVLRYTRNKIAILDPAKPADGGAPTATIDLSSLVQPGDRDGVVEMTAGVYVPSQRLVYVLLGNIDRKSVSPDGYTILCAATKASVVAIDVDTDKVVALTGGTKGALPLRGFNPTLGAMAYDAAGGRLLVMHAGCNQPGANGGAGPVTQRMIEEVDLFTGQTRVLLDANALGFPSALAYIDERRAIVQLDFSGASTYLWDPRQPALGSAIPSAPDAFVYDGQGSLLGLSTTYAADGGSSIDVVSVRVADGKRTTLATEPFTLRGGFVGGVDLYAPR